MIKLNKYNIKVLSGYVTETDFNNESIIMCPWVSLIGCHFTKCIIMVPNYIDDGIFGDYHNCKFINNFILKVNTKSLTELSNS